MRSGLFIVVIATALAACSKPETVQETVRPVTALQVRAGGVDSRDVYAGEVRARYESDIGFRIGGKVVARLVDAGASVRKGQVLARLDPEDARLAAQGTRAQVAAAESELAMASADLARYRDLLDKKFISASAFDARQNAFNAAKSRLEQAQAQAAISANQASYTTLLADADGVVVSVLAEPGQVVAAGQPVVKLARAGEREIVVNAPESQLARFTVGKDVAISLWSDPGRLFRGRIREVAGGADPVTRTYLARVSALETPPEARIGMSANVHIAARADEALILVPLTALARSREDPAVWVVDPATKQVNLRPVAVTEFREDGAAIASGLASGEWVVTAGVHKLRAGQVVRLAASRTAVETARNP